MKYSMRILTTVTLLAAVVLSGCDSPSNEMENAETSVIEANQDLEKSTQRDLESAQREVEAEFRMYRTENSERIEEYDQTINEIEQQIENESDSEVRARLETKLDEVKTTQRELKREMDNYEASGRENWDDFKDSFSEKMDDFGDSLDDFFSTSNPTSSVN